MARSFFRIPSGELTNSVIPLDYLLGRNARELERRLCDERLPSEAARLLAASLPAPANAPNSVQRTVAALADTHGLADLDFFSRAANLSPRQFRRRCLDESGLTPKHLCRILRFRRALHLGNRHMHDWAGIAAETGYFDQAHLIRDFREFTGQTPMAVFSNPAPQAAG
jgi:AraC-like DNA-binding protein